MVEIWGDDRAGKAKLFGEAVLPHFKKERGRGFRRIIIKFLFFFGAIMRLVTFENLAGTSRIGAYIGSDQIVDLNSACALHLRDHRHEAAFDRLPNAFVPPAIRRLFEGGDTILTPPRAPLAFPLQ